MQAKQVLHKLLQKVDSQRHKLRRTALAVNVMAALHGEVLTVTQLGRSITSRAKEKHGIKRADRLLSNRRFLQRLQAMLPPACRPIMLMRGFAPPGSSKSKPWAGTGSGAFAIDQLQLGGEDAWIPCKALDDKATPTPKALGPASLTRSNPIVCQLVLYKAKPRIPL